MKRILIIQTAFPGDAILTLPMIQKLAQREPDSAIDVLAIPATESIFRASPYVNKVIVYDKKRKDKSLFSVFRLVRFIRSEKYSALYSPHRSSRTSIIVFLSGIKNSFGFDISSMSWVYGNRIKYHKNQHEVERNLSLLGDTISDWKISPVINEVNIDNLLPESFDATRTIVIAPGSVWKTKRYPLEYFQQIVKYLIDKGYYVILLGGKEDFLLCEQLDISSKFQTKNLAGQLSIVESISLLKKCRLLISNDSAPTHMAVAADIPVLTIYCSTIPGFGFFPYHAKGKYISYENLKCKPCGIHGHNECPEKTFNCGYLLIPESVQIEIDKVLAN